MRGSLHVSDKQATGWAFDPAAGAHCVQVRIRVGDRVIGEGLADLPHPGLTKRGIPGNHAFRVPLAPTSADAGRLALDARTATDQAWQPVALVGAGQNPSVDGVVGASPSTDELSVLRLSVPRLSGLRLSVLRLDLLANRRGGKARPLEGLSVLDLGCADGFFCGEALRQGARRVVGIDANARLVERARTRFPSAELRCGSWWELPDEKFDVILLLSAIHHEKDQSGLLRALADRLVPGGTLVIECGIAPGAGKAWKTVARADGKRRFPTQTLFVDEVCAPFVTRTVGPGVPQRGDPVTRKVFHCALKQGMALLIAGRGRIGKSTLAREFQRLDVPVLKTDQVLDSVLRERRFDGTPLAATVRRFADDRPAHFGRIGSAVVAERPAEFIETLLGRLPSGRDMVCIEGEILRYPAITDPLMRALEAQGLRPWLVAPRRPSAIRTVTSRVVAVLKAVLLRAGFAAVRTHRSWKRRPAQDKPRADAPAQPRRTPL